MYIPYYTFKSMVSGGGLIFFGKGSLENVVHLDRRIGNIL
jgi:hypothetical protein